MKNILLLVHDDDGQEARLQVALDVTRALGGHLECLHVMTLPMIVSDYFGGGADAYIMAEVRKKGALIRDRLEERLQTEGLPWTMEETLGNSADTLNRSASLADLIVMSCREEDPQERHYPERLPLKAERPILAVPLASGGLNTAGKALVAWDGSGPCIEAVRGAVPLLRCAGEVALLELNQPDGALAMTDVASYLSRHGIAAELVERTTDDSVADAILGHAEHRGADYIVMGAYSSPRSAEALFGGVTRSMLMRTQVPLLLAH